MKKIAKNVVDKILMSFNKRLTNLHSPAKPYAQGMLFLKELIDKPDWIIDIGVADGTPDLTNAYSYTDYKYLLIEANPNFQAHLTRLQQQFPNIEVEKCFCGEEEKNIEFHINKTGHTASRYSTQGEKESLSIQMKTLDKIAEQHKVSGKLLLKIDVEGAELDVLRGAKQTLKMCDVVVLESWINTKITSPSDFASIITFMKDQAFELFDIFGGHCYKNGILKHIDLVFLNKRVAKHIRDNKLP